MAWTELTRRRHARTGDRYASDLTDPEWALIAELMPPRKATGRVQCAVLATTLQHNPRSRNGWTSSPIPTAGSQAKVEVLGVRAIYDGDTFWRRRSSGLECSHRRRHHKLSSASKASSRRHLNVSLLW
jgi:hypothetical protein